MFFNSLQYAIFLPVVVLVYYRLRHRAQNVFLLLASYFFYACWDYRFLALIFISTAVDYVAGIQIERWRNADRRNVARLFLIASLVTNLGLLGFFKYFNFFAWGLARMLGSVGLEASHPTLNMILPVGISFYTFQTLSYTIDIYRGKMHPIHKPVDFALFVAFFPQLVAGPIERAHNLIPQVQSHRVVSRERFVKGFYLILTGLVRKVVIADTAGVIADLTFGDPSSRSSLQVILALFLYSIQIYGDFGGYSNIARGSATILGFDLMRNFEHPYFAKSIAEFWHRWHISLSTWLRDYLYIPLGGNRRGTSRMYLNLMITMLLGGLWHGAHWTFVAWGALHGLYLVGYRLLCAWDRHGRRKGLPVWLGRLITYLIVMLTWVVFRVNNLPDMGRLFSRIVDLDLSHAVELIPFAWLVGLTLLIDIPQAALKDEFCFLRLRRPWRVAITAGVVLLLIFSGGENNAPFIYFQF